MQDNFINKKFIMDTKNSMLLWDNDWF